MQSVHAKNIIVMRSLLFWGLLPLLIPQALWVRKTAPRFPEAAGPRFGSAGSGPNLNLIAIGDSIIAGVGARNLAKALVGQTSRALARFLDCKISWHACGSSGVDSEKVLNRLIPDLPPIAADFFVVSVGVNDVTSLSSISAWMKNLSAILSALRHHSPEAVTAVAGLPPLKDFPLLPQPLRALLGLRAETFDRVARAEVSRHPRSVYVPVQFDPDPEKFAADGYHPSEDSYSIFGRKMADSLATIFLPSGDDSETAKTE
jgi:lysophospholipase L1-like esterase